jgi:hypothetical protein
VAAGLSMAALSSRQPAPAFVAAALAGALAGLLGLALVRHFWVAAAVLAWVGFSGTLVVAGCNTSLQLMAPDNLRGRIMSLYTVLSGGIFPIGAFVVGSLSESWGVSTAFAVNGAGGLLALAALVLLGRPRWSRPEGRGAA